NRSVAKLEASAAILLGLAALLALIVKNSPLEGYYNALLTTPMIVQIGNFAINKPILLWINDGLMAIFFLLVGLEIKREMLEGHLSEPGPRMLPIIAALGGIVVPALIYVYCNFGDLHNLRGWAIPSATDIVFALAVFIFLGTHITDSLKICLVTIAILDDLVAIAIIAVFYTGHLSLHMLALACVGVFVLFMLNLRKVTHLTPYIVTGIFLWACVLESGVHATLAGVVLAAFIPLKIENKEGKPPLRVIEHELSPWVAYGVLPLFAFANAGVSLKGLSFELFEEPITLGIILGLFFGKQIGVMVMTLVGVFFKICQLPAGVNWKQYYGMAVVAGIGFTMSLFIGTLAFEDLASQRAVRIGVLTGSLLSGLVGYFILKIAFKRKVFQESRL
ncbi:MAG TPA: Na+/H+ antiporter NhaA, partial [Gammaproteobacteria bacterium]|nr:Na+/H+ antiporter NhaA [Gammaproteobacteria bacterium]